MKVKEKSNFTTLQESVKLVRLSGAFDEKFYLSQIKTSDKKQSNPIKHYLLQGWKAGLEPHPCFNTFYYYQANQDIQGTNLHPFLHFVLYGYKEARYTRQDFFLPDFIGLHPELDAEETNPLKHYTKLYGQRNPSSSHIVNPIVNTEFSSELTSLVLPEEIPATPLKSTIVADAPMKKGSIPYSLVEPNIVGRIDVLESGRVSGWVVNLTSRVDPLEVEILINGIPYQTKPLTIVRPDVEKIYPGNPLCGFEFNTPLNKLPLDNIFVSVRIKGTAHIILPRRGNYSIANKVRHAPISSAKQNLHTDCYGVTIVIPIYNAPEELLECIESVLLYTDISESGHNIMLSDDASPDLRVTQILDKYEGHEFITILRHTTNLGYTGNINFAINACGSKDVVLLNSDTRVTPNWLELLQRTALQSKFIGTVSAVSDNAGAFSVPIRNASNPTPGWFTEAEYGRLITHTSELKHLRIPTTSGFCMYIKRKMLDSVGLFDTENFPKGYGEENDFCMRAGHLGWEHALADNVFIYHERSASFLDSKTKLMGRASDLIPKMYPEYGAAIGQAFVQNSEINQRRFSISYNAIRSSKLPRPRVAYVIGVDSGGTPQTNMDLMSTIQEDYEPYLILCTTGTIKVFQIIGNERFEIESIHLAHPVMPIQHDSDSYKTEIADILQRYSFELIHIRHIGRHGLSIIQIAKSLKIKVIFSLHDFYTVCPNVKLLDAENRYCGGKCTPGGNDCNVELWDHRFTPKLKHNWIYSWRTIFQKVLSSCDVLITTSPYARDLIRSTYELSNVRFDVVPHARDFDRFEQLGFSTQPDNNQKLRVFIPGHIVPAKGLELIKEIKALDREDKIEFHFAGTSKEDLSKFGISHGTYKREEFDLLVQKIKPHVGGVLSIWPETYSHTLTELWSCGLPVITSNYGATGERLKEHGGGWIIEEMTAQSTYQLMIRLIENPSEISTQTKNVVAWQDGYGKDYNIAIMTACYKRIYSQTLTSNENTKEIFVIPYGANSSDTPVTTQHLSSILQPRYGNCAIAAWPASTINVLPKLAQPFALVIQYHSEAESPSIYASIIDLKSSNPETKIILEISADSIMAYTAACAKNKRPILSWLIDHADHVIAPPLHVEGQHDRFTNLQLDPIIINKKDITKALVTTPPTPPIKLSNKSLSYDDTLYNRMDREVLQGSSNFINKHNEQYVAANFTLINWNSLLTKPRKKDLVSIVIPNFDKVGITEKLILTLTKITSNKNYEIIVVDNGSCYEVRIQIENLRKIDPRIRVVCTPVPLMFSVGCNYGAAYAQGEYILFLNNDMEVIEDSWLDNLIQPLMESEDIGIVGGKLLYQDRTIQHAGLVFSKHTNMAYHAYLGAAENSLHVNKRQQMQAVTGACLAMRASDFAKLRGFNPLFINGCEDVDLCLRMHHTLSRKIIYIPEAVLIHLEGKSPGRGKYVLANRKIFNDLWAGKISPDDDKLYSSNGFKVDTYKFDNEWLKPEYRSISVSLTNDSTQNI